MTRLTRTDGDVFGSLASTTGANAWKGLGARLPIVDQGAQLAPSYSLASLTSVVGCKADMARLGRHVAV
jgi:hypothetical protein